MEKSKEESVKEELLKSSIDVTLKIVWRLGKIADLIKEFDDYDNPCEVAKLIGRIEYYTAFMRD